MLNSSDPLVKDRGLVPSRDHETSLALHRKNSIQKEQLGKELRRIDKEHKECIRRRHMQKCAVSQDQKCLVSDLSKLTFSDSASDDEHSGSEEAAAKSPPATARKAAAAAGGATRQNSDRKRSISLPDPLPGIVPASLAPRADMQERFLDRKMSREISKLKKASSRTEKEGRESEERKGKPRIPPNAWYHDDTKAGERSSVFDRLSMESNLNSMSSEQFLQRVRKQRRSTLPQLSPIRTRLTEHK